MPVTRLALRAEVEGKPGAPPERYLDLGYYERAMSMVGHWNPCPGGKNPARRRAGSVWEPCSLSQGYRVRISQLDLDRDGLLEQLGELRAVRADPERHKGFGLQLDQLELIFQVAREARIIAVVIARVVVAGLHVLVALIEARRAIVAAVVHADLIHAAMVHSTVTHPAATATAAMGEGRGRDEQDGQSSDHLERSSHDTFPSGFE